MPTTLTAVRTYSLFQDNDGDGQYDPGDIITIRIRVTNTGAQDATSVSVTDTAGDAGTFVTIVNGSVDVTPIAFDDAYNLTGNTPISFNAAQGVLSNDTDPDDPNGPPPNLVVSQINGASYTPGANIDLANGILQMQADGGFTFTPDTGFEGNVTFNYTARDAGDDNIPGNGDDSASVTAGTVTLTVGGVNGMVWYVDSTGGSDATGDGSYLNPFASLAPLNGVGNNGALTGDPDAAGSTIFVYANGADAYNSGIVLESGQTLRGEGVAADFIVNGITISSVQTDTQIEYSTFGVELNQNNTILGIDLVGEALTAVGIRDNGATVGTLNISDVEIDGLGQIIDIDNGGALNVTFQSVTSHGSSGTGGVIDLDGVTAGTALTGTFTVTGFTTIDTSGGANTHNQVGISIGGNNTNLASNFAGGTSMNMGTNANAAGIELNANTGSTNFAGLAVSTNFAGNTSAGFVANNAGTLTITGAGNSVVTATGQILSITDTAIGATNVNFNVLSASGTAAGNAIALTNVDGNTLVFSNVTVNNGATGDGINIGNGTSSNVSINTANINGTAGEGIELNNHTGNFSIVTGNIGNTDDPAGIAVDINGGSGNVTIGATVRKTTAGDVVEVTGRTGGTVDFDGQVTSVLGGGIDINGNTSGTVRFDGGLSLSTGANIGLNATSNGSLNLIVTDPAGAPFNVITTTSATQALNVVNTNIGAGGLVFESISASGAGTVNGIVLNNTGTANGLTITGTGGAASGGTITGTSGAGISLTNTGPVNLGWMAISNSGGDGVTGTTVGGFRLDNSTVSGNGDAVGESGVELFNVTGTSTFLNTTITGSADNNLWIQNTVSTLLNLTVTGSTFSSTSAATGNHGILIEAHGSSNIVANISSNTFSTNKGDHFQFSTQADSTSTTNLTFNNNTLTNTDTTGAVVVGSGITISPSGSADLTFQVNNNNIQDAIDDGIDVNVGTAATAASLVQGTISGNTIGTAGNAGSGSRTSNGITVTSNGEATSTIAVTNNTIRQWRGDYGILITQKEGDGTLNATVTGNNVSTPDPSGGALNGIRINSGATATDGGTINIELANNTVTDPSATVAGGNAAIRLLNRFDTDINIQGYSGGTGEDDAAAVVIYVDLQNLGAATVTAQASVNAGAGFFGTASVADPTAPTLPPAPLFAEAPPPGEPEPPAGDPEQPTGDEPVDPPADDPDAPPAPAPHPVIVDDNILSQAELAWLKEAAIQRWILVGATEAQAAAMRATDVDIADMMGLYLGTSSPGRILIDSDAAGYGWFLDCTPQENSEFFLANGRLYASAGGPAHGRMDLLTVLMHELGHQIGLEDTYNPADYDELMYGYAAVGLRREAEADDLEGADPDHVGHESYALAAVSIGTLPAGASVDVTFRATIDAQTNGLIQSITGTATATSPDAPDANDTETQALDSLTLGGTVWLDDGAGGGILNNGIRDGTEAGIDGVSVTLFADTGANAGVWDASDAQVGVSQLTAGGGNYSFTGLAPGNYIVRVDQDNFDAGGNTSLVATPISSALDATDPDDDVDNDDDGVQPGGGQATHSLAITLDYDTEPTDDGAGQFDINTTLDFGFVAGRRLVIDLNGSDAGIDNAAGYTEQQSPIILADGLFVSGPGTVNLTGATVTIADFEPADELVLGDANTTSGTLLGINFNYDDNTGAMTLSGSAPYSTYQSLLRQIKYRSASNNPTDFGNNPDRSIQWVVTDGIEPSVAAATTVVVTAVDDPSVNQPDMFMVNENVVLTSFNLFGDNGSGPDSDPDGPPLAVTEVNGSGANVGNQITLASGALLTVNADGTFAYDPNGKFDTLTIAATGASNLTAQDSFTYRTDAGNTVTVIVQVNGVRTTGDLIVGSAGNDVVTDAGFNFNDSFLLQQGGNDTAFGQGGNDGFYFGAAYTNADGVDGGAGGDSVALQGNYPGLVFGNMVNVEVLVALPGNDTRFGDLAGNFYDYDFTIQDSNVAAGAILTVIGTGLRPGEDLAFDGSAETDGSFRIFAGRGTDSFVGGAGNDGFLFGADQNWSLLDSVDGGGGLDSIALRGNYAAATAITFLPNSFTGVEVLVLLSGLTNEFGGFIVPGGFDYDLTTDDANVAAGQMLNVIAVNLAANESLTFDGRLELDGSLRILSGAGDDVIRGSHGADLISGGLGADLLDGWVGPDTYIYRFVTESTAASTDRILWGAGDRIDLSLIDADANAAGNQAFTFIGSGAFTGVAGQLRVSVTGGVDGLVEGDTNGDGIADLVIITDSYLPVAGDFVL